MGTAVAAITHTVKPCSSHGYMLIQLQVGLGGTSTEGEPGAVQTFAQGAAAAVVSSAGESKTAEDSPELGAVVKKAEEQAVEVCGITVPNNRITVPNNSSQ